MPGNVITQKGVDPFADWLLDRGATEVTRETWLQAAFLDDLPADLNDLDPEIEASLPPIFQRNPPTDLGR